MLFTPAMLSQEEQFEGTWRSTNASMQVAASQRDRSAITEGWGISLEALGKPYWLRLSRIPQVPP